MEKITSRGRNCSQPLCPDALPLLFPLAAAMNFGYLVLLLLQKLLLLLVLVLGWENTVAVKDGEEKNNLFRQLLLPAAAAVKQLRKNAPAGGKMPTVPSEGPS